MPAAWLERRLLIVTAVTLYGAVFIAFVVFEVPGLGLGHFFYIPVALLALAGGTRLGLLGGCVAAALYALAIAVTPRIPTQDVLTLAMAIRLVTYSSCGLLIGWFANEHRRHLEQLREFADRDFLTGLLNTRVFDDVLARRCNAEAPFLLVLGDMDDLKLLNDTHGHTAGNQKLRDLADALRRLTGSEDELARVGGDEFAILIDGRLARRPATLRGAPSRPRSAGSAGDLRLGRLAGRRAQPDGAVPQGRRPPLRREAHSEEPPGRHPAGGHALALARAAGGARAKDRSC